MDGRFVMCPLQGRGYKTGDPFTQGQAPVLGYDALTGHFFVFMFFFSSVWNNFRNFAV